MEPIKISDELKIIRGDTLSIHLPTDRSIDSSIIKKACDTIKSYKLTKIWISNEFSPKFDSLNFLTDFSEVAAEIVEVLLAGRLCDLDNLYLFNNLEDFFWLAKNDEIVDLSRFTKLKILTTSRMESFVNLDVSPLQALHFCGGYEPHPRPKLNPDMLSQLKYLRMLNLSDHVTDFSFEEVNGLDNLERFVITQCNIKNLNGIEKFPSIRSIDACYCYSLNDISAIKKLPNLVWLELGPCSRIKDLDVLANNDNLRALCLNSYKNVDVELIKTLKGLRFLYLESCNPIPSIKFIDDLKNLEAVLIHTKIVDGDLTPAMRMKFAAISDMRHYNIFSDDLPRNKAYAYPYWNDLILNS